MALILIYKFIITSVTAMEFWHAIFAAILSKPSPNTSFIFCIDLHNDYRQYTNM